MSWTIKTLKEHFEALRAADQRALQIKDEGDREARKIKDEADKVALGLARDIQKYKDEKANELREQINKERNLYVTNDKLESALKPLETYMVDRKGHSGGQDASWMKVVQTVSLIGGVIAIIIFVTTQLIN